MIPLTPEEMARRSANQYHAGGTYFDFLMGIISLQKKDRFSFR
jgi:hypothetical protein